MRSFAIAAAFAAFIAPAAFAADMPVKAPPMTSSVYPTNKCGIFYGVVSQGSSGVVNGAPAGTVQIGGDLGGLIGYACPSSVIPWFTELDVSFQNLNAGNAGFSMSGPAHIELEFAVATPLIQYLGSAINIGQGLIPAPSVWLPTGFSVAGSPTNYVGVVTVFDDVSSQYGAASMHDWMWTPLGLRTGLLFNLTGPKGIQLVGDAFAGINMTSNAKDFGVMAPNGSTSVKFGQMFVAGFKLKL